MIKILICCGGGFSSSAMAAHVRKQIETEGFSDKLSIDFSPMGLAHELVDDFDVIMACPHLRYLLEEYNRKRIHDRIPIYVLPPMMYGSMIVCEVYQDALDIIEGFKANPVNPFHFPGEENIVRTRRKVAYRNYHKT